MIRNRKPAPQPPRALARASSPRAKALARNRALEILRPEEHDPAEIKKRLERRGKCHLTLVK